MTQSRIDSQTHFHIFSKLKTILVIVTILIFSILFAGNAFGHGIGGENLPVSIGSRNATLFVGVQPQIFDPTSNESYLTVKLTDDKTDAVIEHVTFIMELSRNGKQIFEEKFHDDLGNVNIKTISKESSLLKIDGDKEPVTGGWTRKLFSPLTMEGPIFTTGGLYKFRIAILSIDTDENTLAQKPTVDGAISIAEKSSYAVVSSDNKNYNFGITTYYDKVNNFNFDLQNRTLSFAMPFDWSTQNIMQTTVVHEEVHIPKNFAEMLVTRYDGFVNGIPLAEAGVTIDDYSEDDRIVHLVLNQQDLISLANKTDDKSLMRFTVTPSQTENLPLKAFTHNAAFQVGLSWEPIPIQPNTDARFYIDLSKYYAPKTQDTVNYDFVIKQNEKELFRKSLSGITNANAKTNYVDYSFSEQNVGTAIVSIENLEGNELSSADFVIVIKPKEKPKQVFPVRLTSITYENEIKKDGRFFVDLTWIPAELVPREESEFIITIYDKETLNPVPQSEYDFVILQNGNEVFRKSEVAHAGGSFVNYKFDESNVGTVTLRIENIDQSGEYVEIPISVTPEFSIGTMLMLFTAFGITLVASKSRIKLNA